ncbi:alpha-ketoglutarate-dependent dioxygenase AlkB [Ferrimonas sediminicola]|uniref:Alpha-ketoglutarate-dependent dioxygenase AlkB n=1 Tax=Ferrimonas sediminicola TaxID=2569538 RepID=A0A4U1BES4_9GAMM|nr:alpha-ketoglutarate-dependent dioxygenase AlkB [Ferrimonas sediminicola]TKB49698.1 alpha-ketoglutarate-dependent dioxygenase AlkB [Ferrimonas sediminicola]
MMTLDDYLLPQRLHKGGVELARYWSHFLSEEQADQLLGRCRNLHWQQPRVRVFGKEHLIPRQQCWLGEPGCQYRYSGTLLDPEPLSPWLDALMLSVSQHCGVRYNTVLANRYRDGGDKMGWHSDNEPEMGAEPQVAILSLGAARPLQLRCGEGQQQEFVMPHGSLLQLLPEAQRRCKHQLPARAAVHGERISLTFRRITPGYWSRG